MGIRCWVLSVGEFQPALCMTLTLPANAPPPFSPREGSVNASFTSVNRGRGRFGSSGPFLVPAKLECARNADSQGLFQVQAGAPLSRFGLVPRHSPTSPTEGRGGARLKAHSDRHVHLAQPSSARDAILCIRHWPPFSPNTQHLTPNTPEGAG